MGMPAPQRNTYLNHLRLRLRLRLLGRLRLLRRLRLRGGGGGRRAGGGSGRTSALSTGDAGALGRLRQAVQTGVMQCSAASPSTHAPRRTESGGWGPHFRLHLNPIRSNTTPPALTQLPESKTDRVTSRGWHSKNDSQFTNRHYYVLFVYWGLRARRLQRSFCAQGIIMEMQR